MSIVPFSFDDRPIRALDRDGEPWFVLNDICSILGVSNPRDVAARLDADEKDGVAIPDTMGRPQPTTIINESGLYVVIMTSRVPQAKKFRKWVTSEVIPSIRKTGAYAIKQTPPKQIDAIQAMLDVIKTTEERVTKVENAVENFAAHDQYRTILAHAALIGCGPITRTEAQALGRQAAALSRQQGIEMGERVDERWGKVKTYHLSILEQIFEVKP